MIRRAILVLLLLGTQLPLCGQDRYGRPSGDTYNTSFNFKQIIVPTVLVGAGSLGLMDAYKKDVNIPIKDYMSDIRGNCYIHADDYIHYIPITSTLLLCLDKGKREGWQEKIALAATGSAITWMLVTSLKYAVGETRPDSSRNNSFPSGHTATSFLGAELVRLEYGNYWGAAAYAIAATTGFLRMYNERHWSNDVLAGAGIGILSAKIAYWLLPWEKQQLGKLSFLPYFAPDSDGSATAGFALSYTF